jgi:cytochrome P450
MTKSLSGGRINQAEFSLFQLLKPEVIADPSPFYRRLREHEPVHWDPYLHSWVVTSYAECVAVLSKYRAARLPSLEHLDAMGLTMLAPHVALMLRQILFMDGPAHMHLRAMCMVAFTPKRVELMRKVTSARAHELIDRACESGRMDLVADFAGPYPAIILANLMGLPAEDGQQLKSWSADVSELLGNFEHNPSRVQYLVASLENLRNYLIRKIDNRNTELQEGVITALLDAEVDGARLPADDVVANVMLIIAGGLEEPANLICCGMFSLLQRPRLLAQLRDNPEIGPAAVEELLRFESPTQHTGRVAPEDTVLAEKHIRKGDMVTVVLAAANRDPLRFSDPDTLDLTRVDNRHLSFGWATHYCLGAPFTRLMGQVAFEALLYRLPGLRLLTEKPEWRSMASLRGISSLPVAFDAKAAVALGKGLVNVH